MSAKIYCTIKYKAIFFLSASHKCIYTDVNIHLITQDNTPYTINNKQFVGWKQNKLVFEYHIFPLHFL